MQGCTHLVPANVETKEKPPRIPMPLLTSLSVSWNPDQSCFSAHLHIPNALHFSMVHRPRGEARTLLASFEKLVGSLQVH